MFRANGYNDDFNDIRDSDTDDSMSSEQEGYLNELNTTVAAAQQQQAGQIGTAFPAQDYSADTQQQMFQQQMPQQQMMQQQMQQQQMQQQKVQKQIRQEK